MVKGNTAQLFIILEGQFRNGVLKDIRFNDVEAPWNLEAIFFNLASAGVGDKITVTTQSLHRLRQQVYRKMEDGYWSCVVRRSGL